MKLSMLLLLFSLSVLAQPFGMMVPSAERLDGESFEVAVERNFLKTFKSRKFRGEANSAYTVSRLLPKYEFPEMESWSNYREVREAFRYVRDLRFVETTYKGEEFMRRSSWLYPDDGCFIRAELMIENLEDRSGPLPKKIFVFGNLKVETKNAPAGSVSWWYHVAPIVALGNKYYVIDPALKTKKPLKLSSWLKLMNENIDSLKIAICDSRTMGPGDSCYSPVKNDLQMVLDYQYQFLVREWGRVLQLDRDPVKELGDNPPWIFYLFGFIPIEL